MFFLFLKRYISRRLQVVNEMESRAFTVRNGERLGWVRNSWLFCICVETLNMRYVLPRKNILNIVTWLILPVVICLSQRLSHACLSINSIPWNCEWLIKTVIVYLIMKLYMDNRGNSRANTCCKGRLSKPCIY